MSEGDERQALKSLSFCGVCQYTAVEDSRARPETITRRMIVSVPRWDFAKSHPSNAPWTDRSFLVRQLEQDGAGACQTRLTLRSLSKAGRGSSAMQSTLIPGRKGLSPALCWRAVIDTSRGWGCVDVGGGPKRAAIWRKKIGVRRSAEAAGTENEGCRNRG